MSRALPRVAVTVALVLLLASAALADVEVSYASGADFARYRTYAWRPGTDAARPEVQELVVAAVERELEASGLQKASGAAEADLFVVTRAFAQMDANYRAAYVHLDRAFVGVAAGGAVLATTGVLMVDLLDGTTEEPVFRAAAHEALGESPNLDKVRKAIDKTTRKFFKGFPPK
jgi:hypothetical protein